MGDKVSAIQVSVSVGPERLSVAGTTRDPGHHSRYVPRSIWWPPRHAALAPMALAAASRFIGVSLCPSAPGAPDGASADVARDVRAWGRSRCTVCGFDALLSLSLWAVTSGSQWSAQGNWGNLRVVTTGSRRVVTTRLAQGLARGMALAKLQQFDKGCRRFGPAGRIGGAVCPGAGCDAGWGRVGF